ncbi:MAG TPA: hypothetical protein VGC79_00220, partial [Polyangiaceae bacterium]
MIRSIVAIGALCVACGSSSDPSHPQASGGEAGSDSSAGNPGSDGGAANPGSGGNAGNPASCPNLSGAWDVTAHCDASLVGMTLLVTQNACLRSLAAPFDAFRGRLTADGTITLSGPQS